ncbi:MAG: HAD-IIIA family hydrolase [bacterium]
MRNAFFIDRDGVLNKMVYDEVHGLMDSPRLPEQVQIMKGAGQFLRQIRDLGYLITVVTNQPGLAKGTLTLPNLTAVNLCLAERLARDGGRWDDMKICPHHPDHMQAPCDCRKPLPGLLLAAARDDEIDLSKSWMMGDGLTDVQAGRAAGCRTILFTTLKLEQISEFFRLDCRPDVIAGRFEDVIPRMRLVGGIA